MIHLKKERKNFRKLSLIITFLILIILIFGLVTVRSFKNIENQSRLLTTQTRIEEYRIKITERINSDFQLLQSIALFLNKSKVYEDNTFLQQVNQVSNKTSFTKMGFFAVDSSLITTYNDEMVITTLNISEVIPEMLEIVHQAFKGQKAISKIFLETYNNKKSIGFAVPVYKDEKIIGALAGSYPINNLKSIFDHSEFQDGISENVDLIDTEGNFIWLSTQSVVNEVKENIFDYDIFSQDTKNDMKQQIKNKEQFDIYYTVSNREYLSTYTPVDNTNWYLIYSDTTTNKQLEFMYQTLHFVQLNLIILIIATSGFMIWLLSRIINSQTKLEEIAYYDNLTHCYNMFKFQQQLNNSNRHIQCVVNLDVVRFRFINSEYGKEKANQLLIAISNILNDNLSADDFFARDYSASFLIAFKTRNKEEITQVINSVVEEIEKTSKQLFFDYKVKIGIGGAFVDQTQIDVIERAKFALRESKNKNNSKIIFWSEIEENYSALQFYIESHKESALQNGEFKLFLQPKKNYSIDTVDSAEILVRWIKPDGQMIFPDQFIHHFEENGFCVQLDLYMFEQACKLLKRWKDEGKQSIMLSVNQSKLLFYKDDYVQLLSHIIEQYDVDPSLITLEILENLSMYNIEHMNTVVLKLREKGFRVSIDDFGSGYSSLNTLGSLKVNEIKLDRCFLLKLEEEPNNKIIFENLVKTVQLMSIAVVIEGVETQSNETFIKNIKADWGQGYFYSKPIPLEEFEKIYIK